MLPAEHRVAGRWDTPADRSMTRNAGREVPRGITAPVELLARFPIGWVGFEAGRLLSREIRCEIDHVLVRQRRCHRRHDRIVALAILEVFQLLNEISLALTGEIRPLGIGAVAIRA